MAFRTNAGRGSNGHGVALFATTAGTGATQLVLTTAPGTGGASPYTVSPTPVVTAKSGAGVTDTSFVGVVTCTLNVLSGSPVLSGTTTKTAVAGVADFSANGLTVTGAGTWTLTFSSGSLSPAVSATGTTTGPFLQFSTQPGGANSGSAFSPQPVVTAKNPDGSTNTSFTGNVTLAVNTVTGSHALGGTVTVAAVAGVATFTNVTDTGSGNATLTATATGYSSATSASFTTAAGGFSPFDLQLNFRASVDGAAVGGITDGAGQEYVLGTDAYTGSAIRGSAAAWGYTSSTAGITSRDRQPTSVVPAQMCGCHFSTAAAADLVFRVNLPAAGTYAIRLALGDGSNATTINKVTITDGATTVLGGTDFGSAASGHFRDASGADRFYNNAGGGGGIGWVETNVAVSCAFAGTTLILTVDKATHLAHIRITRTA